MIRKIVQFTLCLLLITSLVQASVAKPAVSVRGYTRKDGTYVAPHHRSAPDSHTSNNWSSAGNVNPYTGKVGSQEPLPTSSGGIVWVNGYYRKDGTYVSGYFRPTSGRSTSNNWSPTGNVNPYTDKVGSQDTLPTSSGDIVWVNGYYRKDGTYVAGYFKSAPASNTSNNRSSVGNEIQYTGKVGSKNLSPTVRGATVRINGYYRKDGKYVSGYNRSTPSLRSSDCISSLGDDNLLAGQAGSTIIWDLTAEVNELIPLPKHQQKPKK